ncbi:S1 family peptidase [Allosalinactinospora lopnorensis]|uniref:S1 family peptidase n=1 Tax=Allosalinactinospora lopnorensis TaxID=1352348 RepID=UPI000623E086|nr:serine protease [Allosalinactinospora lopnorensis]
MPLSPLERSTPDWQLRVRAAVDGRVVGAGVVLSRWHVLTCAHVVAYALGEAWDGRASVPRPQGEVRLDDPRGDHSWQGRATAPEGCWFGDRPPWDAAVLSLDRPAPSPPALLRRWGESAGPRRAVSMVGFVSDVDAGVWAYGLLGGRGGPHSMYVQIDLESPVGARVVEGFSGSGVRENRSGGLLGIVCQNYDDGAGRSGEICWMIPVEAVPDVWGGHPAPQDEPPSSPRSKHELVVALCEVRCIADPDYRSHFLASLDGRIRHHTRVDRPARLFAFELCDAAMYHGLLHDVLTTLDMLEEGSAPMGQVWAAAEPLLGRNLPR